MSTDRHLYGIQFSFDAARMVEERGKSETSAMYAAFRKTLSECGCVKAGTCFYTVEGDDRYLAWVVYELARLEWPKNYLTTFDAFVMVRVYGLGAITHHSGINPAWERTA